MLRANNHGTLSGNLARDPEVRSSGSGSFTTFTLAVSGWDPTTKSRSADFFRCVAFGKTGETIGRFSRKGSYLNIAYHLAMREWTDKDGTRRSEVNVVAEDVDLGPRVSSTPTSSYEADYDPRSDPFSLTD